MKDKGDLPIGFTMSLAMDPEAMNYYASLPDEVQDQILDYVGRPGMGDEGKTRVDDVVHKLHNHMINDRFY